MRIKASATHKTDYLLAETERLRETVRLADKLAWSLFGRHLDAHSMSCLEKYREQRGKV